MPRGVYERTPEMKAKMSKSHMGVPLSPEHKAAMSVARLGVPISPHTPEQCAAMSKASRESDAVKAHNDCMRGVPHSPENTADKAMRGGDDMCWHHILYDHDDLSKHRVPMTRRSHNMGHAVLRILGIEIPHINIKEV